MKTRYLPHFSALLLAVAGQPSAAQEAPEDWDVTIARGDSYEVDFTTDEGTWMSTDVSPDGHWIAFTSYRFKEDGSLPALLRLVHLPSERHRDLWFDMFRTGPVFDPSGTSCGLTARASCSSNERLTPSKVRSDLFDGDKSAEPPIIQGIFWATLLSTFPDETRLAIPLASVSNVGMSPSQRSGKSPLHICFSSAASLGNWD